MTQYQLQKNIAHGSGSNDQTPQRNLTSEVATLRKLVQEQQQELTDLKRIVKRLRNDFRLAVNTFNLRNHG